MSLSWRQAASCAAELVSGWRADEPGGLVLGFDASGPRFVEARGLASIEHGLPFGLATPTRLASITKHVFCAVALREGMDMAAPLGALVPDLPEAVAAVPLGRALGMTGGLPDLVESFGLLGVPASASFGRATLLAMARALPRLNFAPGASISYTNTGYRLAESALPAPLGALLERHFPGLGFFYPEDETVPVPGLATGYWRDAGLGWRRGRYGLNYSASGGLACSAEALMRWSLRLLAGQGGTAGLWEALTRSGKLRDGRETGYGLGLSRVPLEGPVLWGHGGSLPGYKNHLLLAPELGAGVIVLSNREETGAYRLSLAVMAALAGLTLPPAGRLPAGLFAQADGPFWVESTGDSLFLLGAQEALTQGGGGLVHGLQAHLAFAVRAAADGTLEGSLGHQECRLLPVPEDAALDPRLLGDWVGEELGCEARLTVAEGGRLCLPGQPRQWTALRPLGPGKALAERASPPSRSRFALWLAAPDELRLVSQRSRVLTFRRG
ncbi:serine hydrolase domain-containing protein [Teichococcus coralli]|nr:serine hydrolase domain-containing protein [Pseudoroseomonas coralli]